MKNIGRFYIIKCDDAILTLTKSMLLLGPMPVLWHHRGLYALVPIDIVKDASLQLQCCPDLDASHYHVHWDQTMFQSPDLGPALMSQKLLEAI